MEFALKLWNEKRWLFWLILPLVLLWIFKDLIFQYLISSAKTTVDKAEKKDEELQNKSNKADREASNAEAKAEAIEERIKERDESDISLDWHKKKK